MSETKQQEQKKNKIKQKSNVFTRVFIVKEFVRERWNHRGKKVTNTYKDMARKAAWSVGQVYLWKFMIDSGLRGKPFPREESYLYMWQELFLLPFLVWLGSVFPPVLAGWLPSGDREPFQYL